MSAPACRAIAAGLVALAVAGPACRRADVTSAVVSVEVPAGAIEARVARVIDGDTVALEGIEIGRTTEGGRSARLIGIDTPEVFGGTECFGREASRFARRVLEGRTVRVDFDVERTDRYGRALVYLWEPDGTFFNARIAAEGYALQSTFPPNVRYAEVFRAAAAAARERGAGLWGSCR